MLRKCLLVRGSAANVTSSSRSEGSAATTEGPLSDTPSSSVFRAPSFMGSASPHRHRNLSRQQLDDLATHPLTHAVPARVNDHLCIRLVKALRWIADRLFRDRFLHRAVMLKSISGAPPAAAAVVEHMRCILKKNRDPRVSRTVMNEAECHQMHLKIILELTNLTLVERWLVLVAQALHFVVCFVIFVLSPRMGFRLMGYALEESSVILTHMVNDIDMDKIVVAHPPPVAALEFWGLQSHFRLPEAAAEESGSSDGAQPPIDSKATIAPCELLSLRDVILLMRSDEMYYRDVNHAIANRIDAERTRKAHGGTVGFN